MPCHPAQASHSSVSPAVGLSQGCFLTPLSPTNCTMWHKDSGQQNADSFSSKLCQYKMGLRVKMYLLQEVASSPGHYQIKTCYQFWGDAHKSMVCTPLCPPCMVHQQEAAKMASKSLVRLAGHWSRATSSAT